ncbi:MAG: ComEC/Rec2 family competence protein, partial [Candidatus Atribacteria bacterium]|nr:ComEC/Rec2 family competence protein [Candidatus Atribacteria bacterium]MCD6350421.1 ComEC/Rec2 family competence protein [Candidatus Atribacteria bacterium]
MRKFYFQKRTVGYLEKIKVVSSKKDKPWYQFMKFMKSLKEKFSKKWDVHLKETFPLFFSLLTGQKTKEFYQQSSIFQEVGVFHLFCVSGLHLGLIGGIIFWIAQKFFPYRHFVPFLTSILFTFLYLCIASLAPSALRAWIMFSSYFLSLRLGRNTSQISYFLIALLIMVFLDPAIIFDTGAQLSFASTLGIIFFIQEGFHCLTITNVYLKTIWSTLGTTLFVVIFSMPFLLVKELTFSSLTFIGNILIAPLLEITLILSLIIQPVAFFFPALSQFFGKALYHLFRALLLTAQRLTSLPHFFWDFSTEKEIMKGWLFWLI